MTNNTWPLTDFANLDQNEVELLRKFLSRMSSRARPMPETLWHYTSAQGLLSIIHSGKLYATQVACLNDTQELQHLAGIIARDADGKAETERDATLSELYATLGTAMRQRNVSAAGVFVTCLSSARDDLSQWRGYGSDSCSFAIELETSALIAGLAARGGTSVMLRVLYEPDEHQELATLLVGNVAELYSRTAPRSADEQKEWYDTFGRAYTELATIAHARVKHPKFRGEQEYRLFTELMDGEHEHLEFSAKRTLLARHLPLKFGDDCKLPIRSVMVGPTGYPSTSQVSAGDLLKKYGYGDRQIHLSEIPYRDV